MSCRLHVSGARFLSLLTTVALVVACGDQSAQSSEGVTLTASESGTGDENDGGSESGTTGGLLDLGDEGTTGEYECTAPFPANPPT